MSVQMRHPYAEAHARTSRANADYRLTRPSTLRAMLERAQSEYAAEPPVKMHSGGVMDDHGDPAMTGRFQAYIGFQAPRQRIDTDPDDWRDVACRRDVDGFYASPMRCAIASIRDPERRAFVRDLVTNVLFPKDVAIIHGIPEWCAAEVTYRSLELLFSLYAPRPLPGPSRPRGISDAQADAEAVA